MERAVILPRPRVTASRVAIVLGVGLIGLCVAAASQRQFHGGYQSSTDKVARIAVHKFVLEALPQWQLAHHAVCPSDISELTPYMNSEDVRDPWGHRYLLICDPVHERAAVISRGPDADDDEDVAIVATD